TLEDVLEQLVGDIADEMDVAEEETITRVSRNEVLAAGDADLREINHVFNTSFPQLEHRSLNGYLLEELGRVRMAGERLERDGILIEVLEAPETQVLRARLQRITHPADAVAVAAEAAPQPDAAEAAAGEARSGAAAAPQSGPEPPAAGPGERTGDGARQVRVPAAPSGSAS